MPAMNFIAANGINLHVQLSGQTNALPLVFINSLGSDLRIWDELVPAFDKTYKLLRYDKRGHGLSDSPAAPYTIRDHSEDLAALLAEQAVSKAVLIGISIGGMVAMDFAASHPEMVEALVLCDTYPKIGTADMWNERINTLRQHGMASLSESILERWFAPGFADEHPAAYRGYQNMLERMPLEGYTASCAAIRDADLTDAVRSIQAPTLLLCGADDASTPPERMRGLLQLIPDVQYVEINNAGHLPCIENPDAVSRAIQLFLKDVLLPDDKFDAGMRVRRAVLGDAHVERAEANKTDFDAGFQRFITETAWGTVWTSEGLDRQTRHLLVIALLAALGKENEVAMHIRATQNTGVTPQQVREVLQTVAIYAGVPAANSAFGIAKKVYQELGVNLKGEES